MHLVGSADDEGRSVSSEVEEESLRCYGWLTGVLFTAL